MLGGTLVKLSPRILSGHRLEHPWVHLLAHPWVHQLANPWVHQLVHQWVRPLAPLSGMLLGVEWRLTSKPQPLCCFEGSHSSSRCS